MGPHSFECGIAPLGTKYPTPLGTLQWGRTHSSAEYRKTLMASRCSGSFNGAALIRVRNNPRPRWQARGKGEASMGPHSFECGIATTSTTRSSVYTSGFNGAALIRVRNTPNGEAGP